MAGLPRHVVPPLNRDGRNRELVEDRGPDRLQLILIFLQQFQDDHFIPAFPQPWPGDVQRLLRARHTSSARYCGR